MDAYYFRQIKLPFRRKAEIIHALLRFIVTQCDAVPRDADFFKRFAVELPDLPSLKEQLATDPWLAEHIALTLLGML